MKMLVTKMLVSSALLTLVAADTAYAQTYRDRAPATADDPWESGKYGPPVRVRPGTSSRMGKSSVKILIPIFVLSCSGNTHRAATGTAAPRRPGRAARSPFF
jgi:hypothetical protein